LQASGAAVLILADDGTVAATLLPLPRPRHLPVESGNHTKLLAIEEIDWIEAAGKHVTVHSEGRTFRLRAGLTKVTEQLPYPEFIRVHRSVVVRAERVRELHRWFRGAYYLVLTDGTRLASGATYRTQIERALLGGQRPPL
jgi:two-component system, LytTR family, response regulator